MATQPHITGSHSDGLTDVEYEDLQEIAARHDQKSRKDATLNMRMSSDTLSLIKEVARQNGYAKYQQWVNQVISDALLKALNAG
jgi:predicted DNA binding CopG/RHH family protein